MRVICINVDRKNNHDIPNLPHPEIGEEVTVINDSNYNDERFFQFKEYAEYNGKIVWYNEKNFLPLSALDETKLVTEEFEEKYCLPVNHEPCV